jgi:hypothetical protein
MVWDLGVEHLGEGCALAKKTEILPLHPIPMATSYHRPHILLSVTVTLSEMYLANDKMNASSRCVARASVEDNCHTHIMLNPKVPDHKGERDPKLQAPPLRLGWEGILQKG